MIARLVFMRRSPATLPNGWRTVSCFRAWALGLCLFLTWAAPPAHAQDAKPARSKRVKKPRKTATSSKRASARKRRARAEEAATPKAPPATESEGTSTPAARKERSTDTAATRAAETAAQGVDSEVVKEGDTSVKVMRFSGLDVEGRLKSPQLLYFVNRVRAEFDRPKLPHRSFMPELERSTKRDPL